MSGNGVFQILLYFGVLTALAWPLGAFIARVYLGERTFLSPVLGPVEQLIYRLAGVRTDDEMDWKRYAVAVIWFSLIGVLFVYALQRLQGFLPLNPQDLGAVSPDSSFNTAVSFVTNTNWQGYGGESTMSYLVADARAGGAELRVGRRWHGGAGGVHPRIRAQENEHGRQLLG